MAFYSLEQLAKLHDGYMKAFQIEGRNVLLIQESGSVYIIENRCPHMDVPLASGTLLPEEKIRCRAHGIAFDLKSGRAEGALADTLDCLNKYVPEYHGNMVGVVI